MTGEAEVAAAVTARYDRGARIAIIVIAAVWHLAVDLPGLLDGWPAYRWPVPVALAWLTFAAVGAVGAVRLLRDADGPVRWLLGALLAANGVVFAGTPGELVFLDPNWGWGAVGWFAVILLWWRPLRLLIAVLAVNAGVALVAVLAAGAVDRFDLSRYGMSVYGTVALQLAFATAVRVLGTVSAQAVGAASAAAAVEADRQAAEQAHRDRRARYGQISRAVGGLLDELATGRADPADPAVRHRSAVEAARLRRLIAESDDVPDPLLHELRACADLAERAGVTVEMCAVGRLPPLPVEVRRLLAEPLARPLATARGSARVTVWGSDEEVAVSVLAAGAEAATDQGTGRSDVTYTYEREEGLLWVETRWRAR